MRIYNNREAFYQWDMNQKITDTSFSVGDQIHFTTPSMSNALVVACYELDGVVVADVPNILLQGVEHITAYKYMKDHTRNEYTFPVMQRAKPDDYVYTETEVKSFEALEKKVIETEKRITEAEENAKNFGTENAGKLVYIGDDGNATVLDIGAGLKVINGVLMIDGLKTPNTAILGIAKLGTMVLNRGGI